MFALYADLRRFMVLSDKLTTPGRVRDDHTKASVLAQAHVIFNDYILDESDFCLDSDLEVVQQLRQSYDTKASRIKFPVNELLFQNLILFAAGGLDFFYEQFKLSERYQGLRMEVFK